jgi:hypothetical protein
LIEETQGERLIGHKYFSKNFAVKCLSYENADKVRQVVNG